MSIQTKKQEIKEVIKNNSKLLVLELMEFKDLEEVLNYMYSNANVDNCYFRVLNKKYNKYNTYSTSSINTYSTSIINTKGLNKIISKTNKEDLMCSLNLFTNNKSAAKKDLFCINCIAIDVDFKKDNTFKKLSLEGKIISEVSPKNILRILEGEFFNNIGGIPMPNMIEMGNQLRLIYVLKETVYIPKTNKSVLKLAERISKVFSEKLKDYGAEEQKLESYFRVVNSINTKNNSTVKMYYYKNSYRYTLKELQQEWLEDLPKWYADWKKDKKNNKNKVKRLSNIFTLNTNRLLDLKKIQDYLNTNNIKDYRERLCFLYRNYVLINLKNNRADRKLTKEDFEIAKKEMLEFNNNFKYPLLDKKIESETRSLNTKQYIYKNKTIIDFLEFDEELCKELDLHSIYITKTKEKINKDYYENNKQNKEKKKIDKRRNDILKLIQQGFKQKNICEILNISEKTYKRDRKNLKEQGLI